MSIRTNQYPRNCSTSTDKKRHHYIKGRYRWITCLSLILILLLPGTTIAIGNEIYELDLQSLMEIQITSVSRKPQNLTDAAAAIYVINREDIRNSGATSIMELLRQVPGLAVAQVAANKWAITARGFNGLFANKLLVQIDGRSVYSPSFSGVYWEDQNVVLEDIERIEIIRGPGATLWGANAVNGIINVITSNADDSQGTLISVGAGNQENRLATIRYGFQLNENIFARFHLNHHSLESSELLHSNDDAYDESTTTTGGIRFDGIAGAKDTWTLQADTYNNEHEALIFPYWTSLPIPQSKKDDSTSTGTNILGRWQHHYNTDNSYTIQSYLDYTNRQLASLEEKHWIFDLDFQHQFDLLSNNEIIWGLGYRLIKNKYRSSYMMSFNPDDTTDNLYSGFLQDTIELKQNSLWLTIGCKFEHNEYTESETQPSARIMWKVTNSQRLWAAISRAVRTPSNYESFSNLVFSVDTTTATLPKVYVNGSSNYGAENVIAYETGYRYTPNNSFSLDLALFYNKYRDLQTYKQVDNTNINITNDIEANSYGLELTTRWQPLPWLTTQVNYSFLSINTHANGYAPGDHSVSAIVGENSSPRHQVALLSAIDLSDKIRLNLQGRFVDELAIASTIAYYNQQKVDKYYAVDANIVWSIHDNLSFQLVGKNLFDDQHLEFVSEFFVPPTEIGRSIYAKLTWQY
jgi:iron complex outermembrane receptor protein